MDLLIEQNGIKTRLSDLGLFLIDFDDKSPSIEHERKSIKNRNGYVPSKSYFKAKTMSVNAKLLVPSLYAFEEKQDELNGLLVTQLPFYVTKMLPTNDLYQFEIPGQKTGFNFKKVDVKEYKYRYEVYLSNEIDYSFIGKTNQGLLYGISFNLATDSLPFGQTKPINEVLTGNLINYSGTADCSQLEWPWQIRLTASEASTGQFYFSIGSQRFEYKNDTAIKVNDVFLLKGFENTLNGLNINHKTNYQHFVLLANATKKLSFLTNFKGKVELINKTELYK